MTTAMIANGSFFLSYLFGWFYLWTVSPGWRMPDASPLSLVALVVAGVALLGGSALMESSVSKLRKQQDSGLAMRLYGAAILGALQFALILWVMWRADLAVTETSHDAILMVGLYYALLHSALGAVISLLQGMRVGYRYVGVHAPFEPVVVAYFWRYNAVVFWILIVALAVLPRVIGS